MTLILKLDLDIVKMYQHTKNEVSMSTSSKVIAQTDRHTHTHNENITSTVYTGGNNAVCNTCLYVCNVIPSNVLIMMSKRNAIMVCLFRHSMYIAVRLNANH